MNRRNFLRLGAVAPALASIDDLDPIGLCKDSGYVIIVKSDGSKSADQIRNEIIRAFDYAGINGADVGVVVLESGVDLVGIYEVADGSC